MLLHNRTFYISPMRTYCFPYSGRLIASLGQTDAQVPHSVHSSGLIEYLSPSEIALTGHSSIHVPHATHSSLIT